MRSSLNGPTKAEGERIAAMLRLGCAACAHIGLPNAEAECHHILEGYRRLGHWYTVGLCPGHHRGVWSAEVRAVLHEHQLVSIADGRKAFTRIYPDERLLWERIQARLKLPLDWPQSKVLPR